MGVYIISNLLQLQSAYCRFPSSQMLKPSLHISDAKAPSSSSQLTLSEHLKQLGMFKRRLKIVCKKICRLLMQVGPEFRHRNSGIGVPAKLPAYSSHFQKHLKQLAMFKRKLIKNCLQENLSAVHLHWGGANRPSDREKNPKNGRLPNCT